MKCINKLMEATTDKRVGNHSVRFTTTSRKFLYHWTTICEINYDKKAVIIDNGGFGTSSTTRAINSYLRHETIKNLVENHNFEIKDLRR